MIRIARELMSGNKRKELLAGNRVCLFEKHHCYIYDSKNDPAYVIHLEEKRKEELANTTRFRKHVNMITKLERENNNKERKKEALINEEHKRREKELKKKRVLRFRQLKQERLLGKIIGKDY